MKKIFLYGPPGSGKSNVGKTLSENLNANFIDVDAEIESETKMTIGQIILDRGESAFRNLESVVIQRICNQNVTDTLKTGWIVVALGGGALLCDKNRKACETSGDIVFLDIDFQTLLTRLEINGGQRPLLTGDLGNKLSLLLEQRCEHYSSFKLRVTNTTSTLNNFDQIRTKDQMAWEIQQKLGCYHVRGMGFGYDVVVESGGLCRIGKMMQERGVRGPIALVCDLNVSKLYSRSVFRSLIQSGFQTKLLEIKPGEENKTLKTVENLWRGFFDAGLDRKSTVVALGGGVVGDLAGFAAATFMRGCPWVVVPTTLLSMVDASLGGKTGFDLPEGKNLIGSFYPPRLVMADPEVLSTLQDEELRSGLAEVIKHGIISDPDLFEFCSQGYEAVKMDLLRVIRQAIGVKVHIIQQDPFESGVRAALNFGHTVGHALEITSHFRLRHGESVAIGMVAEARLAEKLGLTENGIGLAEIIKAVLTKNGLPTEIPADLATASIINDMRMDKKKDGNLIKFALPVRIGKVLGGVAVSNLEMVI